MKEDSDRPADPRPGQASTRRDLFRLLVEGVREYAIFMLDPDGRVVSWNPGAERIKGYSAAEVMGRHFSIFYPPEEIRAGRPQRNLRLAAEHGSTEDEGWRVRRDGSRYFASVVITALREPSGALSGYAKVTRDMTDLRRSDEARRHLALAREAVRSRDEFLAIASHELRTPLTSVQLVLQSLARTTREGQPFTPAQVEKLSQLSRHVGRLVDLVNGLLDVAEMASGELRLEAAPFDLSELVSAVVERFQAEAERRGARISADLPAPILGRWDRRRLEDALTAVVGNAVKYGGGAPIDVRAVAEGDGAIVTVRDRGPGIRRDDQLRVFERFERAAPVAHYGGFGVGLWAARQIVAAHGGGIDLRSDAGEGACFTLTLPLEPPG